MVGKTVSHYRIVATLGSGGMSVVYKAQDTRLGRFVALKFLLEKFCKDQDSLEQFRQEARTASALNHPGICTVHDIDQHRERPFIVMEYLEGETLRDRLRNRGLTMDEAVTCGIHIANTLSLAHAAGIIHRDISPANLFITLDGRVKLLDFGIATLVTANHKPGKALPDLTAGRATLTGTIHYMSPEQALCRDVDARSDVFSVGVVLYEMLAGRRPFRGHDVASTIHQIIRATPASLRGIVNNMPHAIQKVVHKCLEKQPERRYQTAAALRDELKSAATASSLDTKTHMKPATGSTISQTESRALPAETIPDREIDATR